MIVCGDIVSPSWYRMTAWPMDWCNRVCCCWWHDLWTLLLMTSFMVWRFCQRLFMQWNLMLPLLPRCVRERFCQWHAIYAWAALCVSRNGAHTRYRDCNIVCIHLGNPLDPIDRFLISTKVAMPERFCQWHARYAWAALCVSRNEAHTYTLSRLQCCLHTSWETLGSNRQISYLHRGCHARVP